MKPGARTHGVFTRDTRHVDGDRYEAKVTHNTSGIRRIEKITTNQLAQIGLGGVELIYLKLEREIRAELEKKKKVRGW